MEPVITHLLESSPLVAVLITAVLWFNARDKRNAQMAEERHKECEARNESLTKRVESLEKRQFERLEDLAERGIAGLAVATAAIRRSLGESPTPPDPLPTLHPRHSSESR